MKNITQNVKKEPSFWKILKKVAVEFCSESSIHGLHYVVECGRHVLEKWFWGSLVIILGVTSLYFAIVSNYNLQLHHTRDHIKSMHFPTYMAPHPAYTFCTSSFQKSRAVRLVNYMTLPSKMNRTEILYDLKYLNLFYNIRSTTFEDLDVFKLHRLQKILNNNSISVEQAVIQLMTPCSELFVQCSLGSSKVDCSKYVFTSKSDIGFCCSLHYLPPSDNTNTLESHDTKVSVDTYFNNYGFESGHAFVLNISVDERFRIKQPSLGAEVFIHHMTTYPRIFSPGIFISDGWETFVRLHLMLRKCLPSVQDMDPNIRQCYYSGEIQLKYFEFYSYSNCVTEARMDFVVKKCNCLPITFPNTGKFKTCTLNDLRCLVTYQFSDIFGYSDYVYVRIDDVKHTCYHKCNSVSYSVHSSGAKFNAPHTNAFKFYDGINTTGLTVVHIFRDSPSIVLHIRESAFYTWDLISAFGGMLGVFLGIHFFSIMEFFNFLIIRLSYLIFK